MKINFNYVLALGLIWLLSIIMSTFVLSAQSTDVLNLSKEDNQQSVFKSDFSFKNNPSSVTSSRSLPSSISNDVKKMALKVDHVSNTVGTDNPVEIEFMKHQKSTQSPLLSSLNSVDSHSLFISKSVGDSDSLLPILVVYPDELVFEFPGKIIDEKNIKRAMARLLLSDAPFEETDWLSHKPLVLKNKPYFYKKILDHNQRPMRYPASVYRYVDHLLQVAVVENRGDEGSFILFHIPVVQKKMSENVNKYNYIVSIYANKFKVSPELIFAIIEVESGFNPNAVSHSNALGLMQLKADAAGKDVYHLIDNKIGMPSKSELFDAENNIRMGAAYIGLLKYEYLDGVKNERSKELLLISSYNGGLTTVLKLFGDTPEKSIKRINQLHPRQVYRSLRYKHASEETRNYLDKVLKTKSKYNEMLDLTV